jgi:hypothetical protein
MGKATLKSVLLLVTTLCFLTSFSQRKISGTIRDDKGAPLVGATVAVKNSRVATTTM